jgi:hypothetical protein
MTKNEIIEMAIQAGFVDYELDDGTTNAFDKRYEVFAKLVAEKEREECASLCEMNSYSSYDMAKVLEEAIRARGQE